MIEIQHCVICSCSCLLAVYLWPLKSPIWTGWFTWPTAPKAWLWLCAQGYLWPFLLDYQLSQVVSRVGASPCPRNKHIMEPPTPDAYTKWLLFRVILPETPLALTCVLWHLAGSNTTMFLETVNMIHAATDSLQCITWPDAKFIYKHTARLMKFYWVWGRKDNLCPCTAQHVSLASIGKELKCRWLQTNALGG